MAPDVSGLAALVTCGERSRSKRVVGGLARVGAEGAHRTTAAAAAPSPTRPPRSPPGPAPTSSAASGRWGGGRSLAPVGVRREAVRHSPTSTRLVGGAVPREGGGVLFPCKQGWIGVLPAQNALVLGFLQSPFL